MLQLDRRHPFSRDSKHVVRPAGVPVVAVGISIRLVARCEPFPPHAFPAEMTTVPIAERCARAPHVHVANLAVGYVAFTLIEDSKVVSGHRLTGAAGFHLA